MFPVLKPYTSSCYRLSDFDSLENNIDGKFTPFALCWVVKIDKNETENGADVRYCYFAD